MDYINVCPKADEKPAESNAWNQTKTSNEETKKNKKLIFSEEKVQSQSAWSQS